MPAAIYFAGTLISLTILVVAWLNFRRKSGVDIRGAYSMASSISCVDRYVHEVILENQKDRTTTIFGVYLQVGYAYLIQIEDFEESPFHLKPYETFHREYGPIEYYAASMYKVDFNRLLESPKVRKRLVLSTSEGRYVIKRPILRWHPISEFFRNSFAAVARPVPSKYKDTYLGSRVKYVVEFETDDGREEIVPIHPGDHGGRRFKHFSLSEDSLRSRDALDSYLQELLKLGWIKVKAIRVHDVDEWRKETEKGSFPMKSAVADDHGFFKYFIVGPLLAKLSTLRNQTINRARRIKRWFK